MSTEVIPYRAESLADRMEYARTLASAGDLIPKGLWAPVKNPDTGVMEPPTPSAGKVLLVLETGAMLGVHPVAALQGIHIIDNKSTISPALMSAVVRGAGHILRVSTEGAPETGDLVGIATLIRKDDPEHPFEARFSLQDALSAELIQSLEQDEQGRFRIVAVSKEGNALSWQKTPRNLVKRRAISEVCRDGAEDVLMGVHYTPEELGAPVDDMGELIEVPASAPVAEPTPPTAAPPARKRATRGAQGTKRPTKPEEPVVATIEPDAPADPAEPSSEPSVPAAGEEIAEPVIEPGTEQPLTAEEQAEADEALRRKVEAAQSEARAAAEFMQEPPLEETPSGEIRTADDYVADADKAASANDLTALRAVWDAAVAATPPMLSAPLQQHILKLKGEVELRLSKADADSAAAATEGKPSTRAAVLGD